MLGCSSSFLYKRSKLLGVPIRSRMAAVDEAELENVVRRLQREFPNSGNEIMRALLIAEVWGFHAKGALWHIDGSMRLIRWGFVIHGAIDGHSRLITYLNCNTDNCSSTVLSQFIQATCLYGIPSRVRSDHGAGVQQGKYLPLGRSFHYHEGTLFVGNGENPVAALMKLQW
ncbi:hypothetical protein QQF64_018532 [Cirrhinus molitorella]|uniref:Integrase core domain-containing protein n=1 Tax=Cirrhinus molitorella TaxID=172907 RepID=A0ABR3LFG4_9TELE